MTGKFLEPKGIVFWIRCEKTVSASSGQSLGIGKEGEKTPKTRRRL